LIPELDIYRAAKLLIDQHGQDAPIRAAERADELLEAAISTAGDLAGHPRGDRGASARPRA
jgi:hypothetical protein